MAHQITIRDIQVPDNEQVEMLIKNILLQLNVPKTGTAYADTSLKNMYGTYQSERSRYFVGVHNEQVVAGAGVAPLVGKETYCELQKMYVNKDFRNLGVAKKLIKACFEAAIQMGFATMYLETLPSMKIAQELYQKHGFVYLEEALGNTGHHNCSLRMIKSL